MSQLWHRIAPKPFEPLTTYDVRAGITRARHRMSRALSCIHGQILGRRCLAVPRFRTRVAFDVVTNIMGKLQVEGRICAPQGYRLDVVNCGGKWVLSTRHR